MSEAQRFVAHAYKTITGGLPEDLSWIGTADRKQVEQVLQSDYVLHQGRWWDKRGGKGKKLLGVAPTSVAPATTPEVQSTTTPEAPRANTGSLANRF